MSFLLDPSQERAVELACKAPIGVVTGGPGTGKTTCMRIALDRLEASGASVALASPTGKAARRLEEATGREAGTLHRLLEWQPYILKYNGPGFARDEADPISEDVVIIDESSMLDTALADALMRAIDVAHTRLIFVGDADQLPSVGPGRVFADLIASERVPTARLTTLHRAAAESWVCSQAPAVLAGRMPDLSERSDFEWIEHESRSDAVEGLITWVTDWGKTWAPELGEAQVLVPQNVGPAGASLINRRLQMALNPRVDPDASGWKVGGRGENDPETQELRVLDRVIQTHNNYDLGIFNGECGVVRGIDDGELAVDFGDATRPRVVGYTRDQAKGLRLAYALSVHKSQGSEWPWIAMLVHSTHTRMLTRQLLYTAITRAKKGVVLVGDRLGLERAVANVSDAKRNTTLAARVRGEELGG